MKLRIIAAALLALAIAPALPAQVTLQQAIDANKTVAAYLQQAVQPAASTAPAPIDTRGKPVLAMPRASITDVYVKPGATEALVDVTLAAPAPMTTSFWFMTYNMDSLSGSTGKAYEGGTYTAVKRPIMFLMGQDRYRVRVPLKTMQAGWRVGVKLVWNEDTPAANVTERSAAIIGSTTQETLPVAFTPPAAPQPRPNGAQIFATDFLTGFQARNGGGAGWFNTMHDSRWINGELGPYVDPALFPGSDPFPVINGVRTLKLEYTPDRPVSLNGASFVYRQPMLSTRGGLYSAVYRIEEWKAQFPAGQGVLGAVWSLKESGGWPPETDDGEYWAREGTKRLTISDHYRLADGSTGKFVHKPFVEAMGIDMARPITMRREYTPETIRTYINGRFVDERPNIHHEPEYKIFSIAAGGTAAGALSPNVTFPVLMPLYSFKAWSF
jgi:hypothetical protein